MSRSSVCLRDAVAEDVPRLVEIWGEVLRRADLVDQEADLAQVLAKAAEDPAVRVVVAELDGVVGGAVYLRATTVSPLNPEPLVQVVAPHVHPEVQRRGLGRALMESAATFAEERGIAHVGSASLSASRDANRFLARLGLGPQAVLRLGTTQTLRLKLSALHPPRARTGRPIGQVLAVRRSQRRRSASVEQASR